jgi:eukaryotic-like serine/threonine-protein kinase
MPCALGGAKSLGSDGCWPSPAAGSIAPDFVVAQRLVADRYRLERLLGGGGMATVWAGHDLRLDRPVAIKELSGEGLRQPMALERFDREARAVGRLSHPNVVSVYDVGTQNRQPYLVMELVEGPTVATLLADGPLPVADVLAMASQICDGLAAAHAAGIIHRDIKPANLIVTAAGEVKICDFGVARMLDPPGNTSLTGPATAWGSPNYMAPEQINGDPIDRRTDLYALGCTMYAMLTGAPPFTRGGTFGVLHQHITAPPESLRLRRTDVPTLVETLVCDLLAKTLEQRPSDARAVRARIAAAQADLALAGARAVLLRSVSPQSAATPTPQAVVPIHEPRLSPNTGSRTSTPKRRRRTVVALAAAAIAVAGAATIVPMLQTETVRAAGPSEPSTSTATSPAAAAVAPPIPARSSGTSPSAAPPPSTRGRAAHTATPTRPPPRTAAVLDPITALRQTISQQVTDGSLKVDAATDLNHMVDDLAKTIATGNTGEVTNKIKALRAKLTTLKKGRQLSDTGYRALNIAVDQVAADQPQPSKTPAPPPPPPPSPHQ